MNGVPQSQSTKKLLIVAFDKTDGAEVLERPLVSRFAFQVLLLQSVMPEVRTRSGQASADDILSEVCRLRVARKADLAIGITDRDLFVPDMSFVFGLASADGACAVVSTNRLRGNGQAPYHERLLKEAIHEIGHVLGLTHCDDLRCVMHFSNSLRDTDTKRDTFCTRCSATLSPYLH